MSQVQKVDASVQRNVPGTQGSYGEKSAGSAYGMSPVGVEPLPPLSLVGLGDSEMVVVVGCTTVMSVLNDRHGQVVTVTKLKFVYVMVGSIRLAPSEGQETYSVTVVELREAED